MENWRNQSTLPDRSENSSSSRSPNQYFRRYQTPNFQNPQNLASSLTSSNAGMRNYALQSGKPRNFRQLEYLMELNRKNSSEIMIELSKNLDDFEELLLSSNLEPDLIVLVIAILSKVCSSYFRETKLSVLKVAKNEIFLKVLEKYVRILENYQGEFIVNLLFVCETFMDVIPTSHCDILHNLLTVIGGFPCPGEGTNIEMRQKTEILMEKLNLCKEIPEQRKRVYPTKEEILTSNCGPSSECLVEEKYGNVKLYLDAHVKLWKDNFAWVLRQDIDQCIEYVKGPLTSSPIKMFPDVVFRSMVFNCDEFGVVVKFSNEEDSEEIFSPRSECFKFGTVVCFTKDNFSTILLGSVIKKDFEKRHLIIGFEPEFNDYGSNVSYTMIQCNVYLYRYYYILQALASISHVDFPFKTYLIDGAPNVEVEPPGYLDSTSSIYLGQGSRVAVFGNNWPSADQLNLDSTQYPAFQAALTQKFVMIEGAHGTGKTYLGLQIIKTLVHEDNQKLWYNEAPILIVCLSNQALDQFLEGLKSTTSRIIRIGQQSKNDKIADFTLASARTRSGVDRNFLLPLQEEQKKLLKQLEEYSDCLIQINNLNSILDFSKFGSIDEEIETSWFSRASKAEIVAWLFDKQNQDLHSLEISDIVKDIIEEQNQFGSEEDDADAFGEDQNISDELPPTILWSKSHTWNQIVRIRDKVQKMETGTTNPSGKQRKLEKQLKYLWINFQCFKIKMSHQGPEQTVSKPITVDYESPLSMDPNDRWNLYFHWLNLYRLFVKAKFLQLQYEYRQITQKCTEIRNILDLEIMKGALVLGMTFTAAARLQTSLQSLKCRIVIMEEACKVSESHIMASLTKHCENLILFDHNQELLPKPNKTRITLGPNIMERMMRNGMQLHILNIQHRIRSKIIELLIPHNYPELETVTKIPPILGMPFCCYFVHHEHRDLEKYNSKVNLYEAEFLVNFARYLRLVGYQAEDILILSTYSGQTKILCDERGRYEDLLKGVRIGTLGLDPCEESKIVLLSSVRNNAEGKIGRLQFQDFVNWALSRAKEALYMMGNIELLSEKSEMWARINEVLVKQNCIGKYLPVSCKVNPDHVTKIKEPKDFDEVPEEVCSKICGRLLNNCGYRCLRSCHVLVDDHTATASTE